MELSRLTRDPGLHNPSRETKFSGANAEREILFSPVQQLTTSTIGSLTRLIHNDHIYMRSEERKSVIKGGILPTKRVLSISDARSPKFTLQQSSKNAAVLLLSSTLREYFGGTHLALPNVARVVLN